MILENIKLIDIPRLQDATDFAGVRPRSSEARNLSSLTSLSVGKRLIEETVEVIEGLVEPDVGHNNCSWLVL